MSWRQLGQVEKSVENFTLGKLKVVESVLKNFTVGKFAPTAIATGTIFLQCYNNGNIWSYNFWAVTTQP